MEEFTPNRYAVIHEKNPREIVMLRGRGCSWRRCRFCDYHLDSSPDEGANFALNKEQLLKVTGIYRKLEVINSGSFVDLDEATLSQIAEVCQKHNICQVHFGGTATQSQISAGDSQTLALRLNSRPAWKLLTHCSGRVT